MSSKKTRWGLLLFICSIPILVAVLYPAIYNPEIFNFKYLKYIPALGLTFSIAAFITGHFSYPRIHNLKVYVLGYITAISGAGYFIFYRSPVNLPLLPAGHEFLNVTTIMIFVNFLAILFLPSFVKFKTVRSTTLTIVIAEVIILVVFRFSPQSKELIKVIEYSTVREVLFWVGIAWFLCVFILSFMRLKQEFYLGGTLCGCALLYAAGWSCGALKNGEVSQMLLLASAPLYLSTGILVHWFSRMDHRIAYDPLLQIYNRDYCSKIISEQANMNMSPPFTVAMVDIDHFKKVNDTYGHQAGDAVLYSVAQSVCKGVIPQGICCRYGGEELAVFFPQMTTKEVVPVMEKVREDIEKIKTNSGKKQISVTISCGVSHRDTSSQNIMDVIAAADKALYKAKEGGRNQVRSGKIQSKKQ
jgi:diguanylate cyclase (GGDEF)-like protein